MKREGSSGIEIKQPGQNVFNSLEKNFALNFELSLKLETQVNVDAPSGPK